MGGTPTPRAHSFPLSHPLACPDWAPEDTHLYVTLGCVPFSHRELERFIVGVINLATRYRFLESVAAANQAPWTFPSSDRLCEHSRDSGSPTWLWSGARTWLAGLEEHPSRPRTGSRWPEPPCRAGLAHSGRDPHEPQQQSRHQVSATRCDWSLSPKLSTAHGNRQECSLSGRCRVTG